MRRLLTRYVLWTYGVFYCFIAVIGVAMLVLKLPTLAETLKVISAWTSTFVFIAMFHKIYPNDSLIHYVKRQFSGRVRMSTVAWIVLLQFSILLGSILLRSAIGNVPMKSLVATSWTTLIVIFGDSLIRGPLGEELGWRGFVLNELQKKFSPLRSAIMVGVAWGFWHTPLWFLSGYSGIQLIEYVTCFLIYIIAASIVMTAFYNRNHNLLIPIMTHQLCNYFLTVQTGDVLQNVAVAALLYSVVAVVLVLTSHKEMCGTARGVPLGDAPSQ